MSDSPPPYSGYGIPVDAPTPTASDAAASEPVDERSPEERPKRRRRWIIGGGVAITAVAVLVAVGVWWSQTPLGVVAQAVGTTLEQGSAATRVNATLGGVPIIGDVDLLVADGAVDFASGQGHFRRQLFGGVATELRYTDEGVFVQVPLAENRWVQLADGESGVGSLPMDVTTVAPGLGNPVALLAMLRSLEASPTRIGRSVAADVPVTVYEVIVDLDATGELLGEDARDVIVRLRQLTGGGELPLRVGIDGDGLIRSVRFGATLSLTEALQVRVDNEILFTGFGVDVEISAPRPERIVQLDPEILARLDPLGALRELLGTVPGVG